MNINRCELSGRLTRDGELRATQSGTPILTFGLAFNDRKRDSATGNWEDVPNFIDCVVFGSFAEGIAQYTTKGRKVFVAGKLRYSSWERDGQKRSKLELLVDTLDFASDGQAQGQGTQKVPQAQQQPTYSAPPAPPAPVAQDDIYDEDIPF